MYIHTYLRVPRNTHSASGWVLKPSFRLSSSSFFFAFLRVYRKKRRGKPKKKKQEWNCQRNSFSIQIQASRSASNNEWVVHLSTCTPSYKTNTYIYNLKRSTKNLLLKSYWKTTEKLLKKLLKNLIHRWKNHTSDKKIQFKPRTFLTDLTG